MAEGTTTRLVAGIGGLVILVIITLVIVSTMINADLFERGTNVISSEQANLNSSGHTFDNFTVQGGDWSITSMRNDSSSSDIVVAGNVTIDQDTGIFTNTTAFASGNVTINYTFTLKGGIEQSPTDLSTNMTGGIDNVSEKLPTILLIAAVVLLFGVLVLLVARSRQMGIDGGGVSSL